MRCRVGTPPPARWAVYAVACPPHAPRTLEAANGDDAVRRYRELLGLRWPGWRPRATRVW